MSKETQFKGKGIGTKYKQSPIAVRFPAEVQDILLDRMKVPDRQQYIRDAVESQLRADGLL